MLSYKAQNNYLTFLKVMGSICNNKIDPDQSERSGDTIHKVYNKLLHSFQVFKIKIFQSHVKCHEAKRNIVPVLAIYV